jgi:hypothetical protein
MKFDLTEYDNVYVFASRIGERLYEFAKNSTSEEFASAIDELVCRARDEGIEKGYDEGYSFGSDPPFWIIIDVLLTIRELRATIAEALYKNLNGNSSVTDYDLGATWIKVYFNSGWAYTYTYDSAGKNNVMWMQRHAKHGEELCRYIHKYVKHRYESKEKV